MTKNSTIKQIEKFNSLEKVIESGILDKDARNWLKSNQNESDQCKYGKSNESIRNER